MKDSHCCGWRHIHQGWWQSPGRCPFDWGLQWGRDPFHNQSQSNDRKAEDTIFSATCKLWEVAETQTKATNVNNIIKENEKKKPTFLANHSPLAWVTHSLEWIPVSIQMAGRLVPPVLNYKTGKESSNLHYKQKMKSSMRVKTLARRV